MQKELHPYFRHYTLPSVSAGAVYRVLKCDLQQLSKHDFPLATTTSVLHAYCTFTHFLDNCSTRLEDKGQHTFHDTHTGFASSAPQMT